MTSIRPALATDLEALADLDRRVFGDGAYPRFFFRQALDALPGGLWVAGDRGLLGYVLGGRQAGEDDAWIWSLGVGPEARGRGLAGLLMDAVEAALRERGATGFRLHVSPTNAGARRLYERRGYREVEVLPDAFGPGHDRLVLRRDGRATRAARRPAMVELHQFPSRWTLPNPSPFCLKVETWLRMAGIPYVVKAWNPFASPHGKAPFVIVDGEVIGDSSNIVRELGRRFGVGLDDGMSAHDHAIATLVQRLLEEHTYWVVIHIRWLDPEGWAAYRPILAPAMPGPFPGAMLWWARRGMKRQAWEQGVCRLPREQILARGITDIDALAELLGDKPYLLGDQPRAIDATVYGFVAQCLQPEWDNAFVRRCREHTNLTAYVERMRERYWASAPA